VGKILWPKKKTNPEQTGFGLAFVLDLFFFSCETNENRLFHFMQKTQQKIRAEISAPADFRKDIPSWRCEFKRKRKTKEQNAKDEFTKRTICALWRKATTTLVRLSRPCFSATKLKCPQTQTFQTKEPRNPFMLTSPNNEPNVHQ